MSAQATDGQADQDVLAMAEHVLGAGEIDFNHGRYRGLGTHAAKRAVRALAAAGLLAERPRRAVPPTVTADQAELLVRRGLDRRQDRIVVAEVGTLRLEWCTAVRGYRLVDHTGEHYRGTDHADAAAAFNEVAGHAGGGEAS